MLCFYNIGIDLGTENSGGRALEELASADYDFRFAQLQEPFDAYFLQFAGIGLIRLWWWPRLATLENIWHGDIHTQFNVAAGGGGAWLGLWPNGL
jgi:hypothetical protein